MQNNDISIDELIKIINNLKLEIIEKENMLAELLEKTGICDKDIIIEHETST